MILCQDCRPSSNTPANWRITCNNNSGVWYLCTRHADRDSNWNRMAITERFTETSVEPACNPELCKMHVGAGVSIDHDKACAYVAWQAARRAPGVEGRSAGCTHQWSNFEYLPHTELTSSRAQVCKLCRVVRCVSQKIGGRCPSTPHGPSETWQVICGKPAPPNTIKLI